MEIEGLINHAFAGISRKKHFYEERLLECREMHFFWNAILAIHVNEALKNAIKDLKHVRGLFGNSEYVKKFIEAGVENSLDFMGHSLDHIQFYIELRDSLKT